MNMLILIIDNNHIIRSNLSYLLKLEDFNCMSAENGLIGLNLAKRFKPDLIICDINMPKLDGYGVLKHLRDDFSTAKIPLIFMSSKTEQENRYPSWQLRANDYLTKPVSYSKLLAAIDKQLQVAEWA